MSKRLYLDNDFEPEYAVTRKNADTGIEEAATGLTGLTVCVSATPGGTTIHTDLEKDMGERASTAGTYYAVIDGDKLRAHLLATGATPVSYVGNKVYVVFGDGTNVLVSDEYLVRETRRSGNG